jgi:hypothetical protein
MDMAPHEGKRKDANSTYRNTQRTETHWRNGVRRRTALGIQTKMIRKSKFKVIHRYGGLTLHEVGSDLPSVLETLIGELREEQFDEPDEEHDTVSVVRDS